MTDVPVLLALTAGMVAALNPCGFALLPAYLTLVVAQGGDDTSRAAAVRRALTMSGAMTAGFVGVFGAFGLVAVPLALSLERYLPWATIVIGVALIGLGVYLLTGRELLLSTPKLAGAAPDRTIRSMVMYGVAYAVASLSCTIGPFLAITTSTFRSESLLSGVSVFVLYGIGMGLVVAVLAVAVALAQKGLITRFRRATPYISRFSGVLLLIAGAYVAYYGYYEIQVFSGADASDPIVGAFTSVQSSVANWVASINPWVLAGVLGALVAAGAGSALWARRRRRSADHDTDPSRTMVG
jgi:cytochrome c biogenesis protein CcdA